jgi:hypothetical protein
MSAVIVGMGNQPPDLKGPVGCCFTWSEAGGAPIMRGGPRRLGGMLGLTVRPVDVGHFGDAVDGHCVLNNPACVIGGVGSCCHRGKLACLPLNWNPDVDSCPDYTVFKCRLQIWMKGDST